jgi:hypothetical protein
MTNDMAVRFPGIYVLTVVVDYEASEPKVGYAACFHRLSMGVDDNDSVLWRRAVVLYWVLYWGAVIAASSHVQTSIAMDRRNARLRCSRIHRSRSSTAAPQCAVSPRSCGARGKPLTSAKRLGGSVSFTPSGNWAVGSSVDSMRSTVRGDVLDY